MEIQNAREVRCPRHFDCCQIKEEVVTKELDALLDGLRGAGAKFRGDISDGGAGRAILLEDSSGNIVELFEFKK